MRVRRRPNRAAPFHLTLQHGFIGPFIAPPGGILEVQAPPHMVVYNHFAPVGQFGQVGLSFMGTTHIPSGKQPDWKHIPTTSAAGTSEGDMNNMNMTSSQRNPASMPSQIQHLAPGSPLLPMASLVAMYDVSPFQHSTEMSVQARWPHVPNAPLSSIPPSMPLHQQESVQTSQMSHGPSVDQSLNVLLTPAANAPLSPPTIPFVNEPPMSSSASDEVATSITAYDIYLQPLIGHHQFGRPQSGFTGPFIAPPGGIPGVQGPPHMVVYNHFAPVGQFGQVGLSFMGTTHIPSGKQPDWKHIPTTSAAGTSEGDMNNMNMTSSQRNPASMPSQIQHLAPGSPLLPMASPVAMYDVSPFQHSTEMSVQARWPHVPNAPLSSIPPSMPLHQ
ncbi:hypothetical protein RYX36_027470 [Vicia faba]